MLINVAEDVRPVTDLRQHAADLLTHVRKSGRPVVITQRGRSAAVLESVEQYEQRLARMELLEAVLQGLEEAEAGQLIPHEEVMRRVEEIVHG
jgi:prevent-host-death family protein